MDWWRITTSEAALWLAVIFLSLDEARAKYDKDASKSQRTWCEETHACAGCAETKRPGCSGRGEPLLGADLCGCCFSCVTVRDLGESCGSQLSTWPDDSESGPVSSSVTILATTWCRAGLVCVNFACLDSSENVQPATSSWLRTAEGFAQSKKNQDHDFGQDMIPLDAEGTLPTAELHQRITAPSWKPILVNHDDPNLRKTVTPTPVAPMPSSASSLTKSRTKPQPCHAESQETMTISSYPSDDLLGRVATTSLKDIRFQLVYTGDLLSELKVLLNATDRFHGDPPLEEGAVGSLLDAFLVSSSLLDADGLLLGDRDYVEVPTPGIAGSQATAAASNPYNVTFPGPRERRELERIEEDAASRDPPENIQEILIRGASAHREYFGGGRGYDQNTNILNKNWSAMSAEASSQEDESTVRVHITNHPRKIQTLIDLEEEGEEEEEIEDEDRRNLQLANKGRSKGVGKLSPLADEQSGVPPAVSSPLGVTEQTSITKKTAKYIPTDVPQVVEALWNETLTTFNDRLTLAEVRINVFQRVLEEMAKWCNLGVLSMTRDCLVPQSADVSYERWGPNTDEHLALASGTEAVKIRGNRRKLGYGYRDTKIPDRAELPEIVEAPRTGYRNFFRSVIDKGSPRRPLTSRNGGPGGAAKPRCGNSGNRGYSWPPIRRTVQRSVSTTNPFSRRSSGLESSENVEKTAPRDHLDARSFPTFDETQIPVPATLASKVTVLRDHKKGELSPLEDAFPQGRASTAEITSSSGLPSREMFASGEKNTKHEEERRTFSRTKPGLGKLGLRGNTGRTKRAVDRVDGTLTPNDTLGKFRGESPVVLTGRTGELFERETAARTGLELDTNENGVRGRVAGPLIVNGSGEFRNSEEPTARRLLFRNSDRPETAESTGTGVISMDSQYARKALDPGAALYSITNRGNSRIRIEDISETEYEDGLSEIRDSSPAAEEDFDHIYESVEAETAEDGDFEYEVAYDRVEYVDGSSVDMATEMPSRPREPETELKPVPELPRGGIRAVLFPQERNRRASRKEDDRCESERPTKREMPLLLFGSSEKHEPKTIVWPSKWVGYRGGRLQGAGGSGERETGLNSKFWPTKSFETTAATSSLPSRTTQSLIVEHSLGNGETNHVVTPKISGLDPRARKNRRKIVWP